MRFASLGSGSKGNATLIQHGATQLLVDCGFRLKTLEQRAAALGLDLHDLTGILVTHEHADHMSGVSALARKYRIQIYASAGTIGGLPDDALPWTTEISSHDAFDLHDIEVTPFPVPHDAREPTQFVFSDGHFRIGLLTDVGSITPVIQQALSGCHALLLESNHDPHMLATGDYPEPLKQRVGGPFGHLSNQQAAELLQRIDTSQLQQLIAMHLSEKNNTPELAHAALAAELDDGFDGLSIACQEQGFAWRELRISA